MLLNRGVLAVGVVLLPPAAIARRAVRSSARLRSEIRLGPRALPHVTLGMAAVLEAALPSLIGSLHALARARAAPPLTLTRSVGVPGTHHVNAWYEIRRSGGLVSLQRAVMAALAPHRRRRVTSAAFHRGRASASSRRFVRLFAEYGLRGYRPHITLGHGDPPADPALPLAFRARRLALCRLGDHCTCARLLWTGRLADRRDGRRYSSAAVRRGSRSNRSP